MKKLLLVAALFGGVVAVAATQSPVGQLPAKVKTPLTPEERAEKKAKIQKLIMERVGGMVVRPGSQQGEIFYVNCQKRARKAWIEESITYFKEETKFKVSYKDGAFDLMSPKIEGNATLFIIEDEKLPAILVAPENRWAFVNIAVIAKEQRPEFFEARVKKQLSRSFAYLCGATNSQYPRSLTRGIVDEADLDKNPDLKLPVDLFQRIRSYMESLGVRPAAMATYRKAIQEGWAPKPANEHQQRIWDELHEVPTDPMVIKPEKHPAK